MVHHIQHYALAFTMNLNNNSRHAYPEPIYTTFRKDHIWYYGRAHNHYSRELTVQLITCSRRRLDRAIACCILSFSNSLARSSFRAFALFCG
jgi:hypothetical protein